MPRDGVADREQRGRMDARDIRRPTCSSQIDIWSERSGRNPLTPGFNVGVCDWVRVMQRSLVRTADLQRSISKIRFTNPKYKTVTIASTIPSDLV